MFQFPRLPRPGLCVQPGVTGNDSRRVFPFGDPRVERASAPNRGLSQLVASFVGFLCQGIHRLPLPSSLRSMARTYFVSRGRSRAPASSDAIFLRKIFRHAMQLSRYGGGVPRGPDTARPRATRLTLSWDGRGGRLSSSLEEVILPRKEVIQPHLPVRLPCYDFTPLTNHTFGASLTRLGRRLRVQSTRVV